MSVAVIELIALELFDRLSDMIGDNSYTTVVSEVIRPTRQGGFTPKNLQIVMTQASDQRAPNLDYPGNPPAIASVVTYNVHCHVLQDETNTDAIDSITEQFASDVVKAIVGSDSMWYTMDGNAVIAELLSHEPVSSEGGPSGVNVPIAITYRVSENDPTAARP